MSTISFYYLVNRNKDKHWTIRGKDKLNISSKDRKIITRCINYRYPITAIEEQDKKSKSNCLIC